MNRLVMAVEEDSEDEAMEEALALEEALDVAMDRLLVTTMELQNIMLGIVRTLLQHVTIASPTITVLKNVLP